MKKEMTIDDLIYAANNDPITQEEIDWFAEQDKKHAEEEKQFRITKEFLDRQYLT